ncbi:MAG TPA: hypothetical protein VFP91_02390 [Vicinamibacterales bacterium]|nr:hypothetical protein [Vicinamibacterales bacterium]
MDPSPFVPKRVVDAKDQFDTKDKFDAKRPFDAKRKVDAGSSQPATTRQAEGALYTLEFPVTCPHCEAQITTLKVFRLLRTHVSFTSTLPRKGYVIVCPECERPISSELSGLI